MPTKVIKEQVAGPMDFIPKPPKDIAKQLFRSYAYVYRVVDGDTLMLHLNPGFEHYGTPRVRFMDLEAEGNDTERGMKATEWVKNKVGGKWIYYESTKLEPGNGAKDQHTRYFIKFYLHGDTVVDANGNPVSINEQLLATGLVTPWEKK